MTHPLQSALGFDLPVQERPEAFDITRGKHGGAERWNGN